MAQKPATYAFRGGIDTNSAALAVPASALIHGLNYEPLAEGYGRVDGYERFDGRTAPSDSSYWLLPFNAGSVEIVIGQTVTGATSGATGVVLVAPQGLTGAWADSTAAGTLVLGFVSGEFSLAEAINISGSPVAGVAGTQTENGSSSIDLHREWSAVAQDQRRALVQTVPGSGPVRGVAVHNGTVYAWRDNVGATECLGYRATAAGWVALTQSRRLAFTNGLAAGISEGATITGSISGATATVVRVAVSSGSFASNSAAGWLHVTGQTGTFQAAESLKVGGTNRATASGNSTLNTVPAGGRYRCISHNFYGASNLYRLYGCNEVGNGFEMVNHVMVPIFTGMATDKPTRVFEIKQHLGFCFAGGSVQFSATGEPLVWTPLLGAGEIGLGTEINDVIQANESAVVFFGQQKVATLTGTSINDFAMTEITEEAGAEPDTAQRIARTVYLDRRGLRSLDATNAYGNFKAGSLSGPFSSYLTKKRDRMVTPVGSLTVRSKSQYRLYWSDGTGVSIFMGNKVPEAIPFDFAFSPYTFGAGELDDGEGLFAGADDGYVYRLDSGNSFDGAGVAASCMTPFNHFGAIMQEKRFHKVSLELQGTPQASITVLAQFDYGDGAQPMDFGSSFSVRAGGGLFDVSYFGDVYFDDPIEGTAECYVDGSGRNASFTFASLSHPAEPAHVLQAYTVHFSPRKMKR